ncbi:MAG: ATP-binding protein [Bacteroidota bacterium]
MDQTLQEDVASIQQIPIVSTLLNVICRTTGMGFAAVARVTDYKWITCSLQDEINFGLVPGDELVLETTICHEIRQSGKSVIIDSVENDPAYSNHHTPNLYGFQSYISVPIYRKDGSFFGTLCAIDPKPAKLNNPAIIGMFNLFSDLISFHLNALEELKLGEIKLLKEREERTKALENKNAELEKMNMELESFAYIASHDLQEPLRKIATYSNLIYNKDQQNLSGSGRHYLERLNRSVTRMQALIKDLILFTQLKDDEQVFELINLNDIIDDVTENLAEDISEKSVSLKVGSMCEAMIIPFQFNQLIQNILSNAIKFTRPGIAPVISITSSIVKGTTLPFENITPGTYYCHISITDNGIGFDQQYSKQIFKVFQRLNAREEFDGTGIGLSIVKKIVDNHKGFINATGEVNKGANFNIYLPHPITPSNHPVN